MNLIMADAALRQRRPGLDALAVKEAVLNAGLEALIARESGRQLIALGATERELRAAPHRRQRATGGGA